ncbi:unnamed protein product [Merluccius merluccius]
METTLKAQQSPELPANRSDLERCGDKAGAGENSRSGCWGGWRRSRMFGLRLQPLEPNYQETNLTPEGSHDTLLSLCHSPNLLTEQGELFFLMKNPPHLGLESSLHRVRVC